METKGMTSKMVIWFKKKLLSIHLFFLKTRTMPLEGHVVQPSAHRRTHCKVRSNFEVRRNNKNPLMKNMRYLQPRALYHLTVKTCFYLDESSFTVTCVHYLSFYNCTSLKRLWLSSSQSPLVIKTITRLLFSLLVSRLQTSLLSFSS